MEPTLEGADAVHRVKRGRPAKAAKREMLDIESGGDTFDRAPYSSIEQDFTAAQAYALRIWDGQSVDVSIPDRVERVVNGLRGQGLSIAVTLPHPDAARYLAKHA